MTIVSVYIVIIIKSTLRSSEQCYQTTILGKSHFGILRGVFTSHYIAKHCTFSKPDFQLKHRQVNSQG
jgi:hypothetical protein